MRINTNMMALNTQRQLSANQNTMQGSLARLSSGLRINSAADDAAGLAISEKMRAQIRGLSRAQENAQDGISLLQTAEGTLGEVTNILQRMRELATQATNDILSEEDRNSIAVEMKQLRDEIDRTTKIASFNGKELLTGKSGPTKMDKINTFVMNPDNVTIDTKYAAEGKTYMLSVMEGENGKAKFVFEDMSPEDGEEAVHEFQTSFEIGYDVVVSGRVNFNEIGIALEFKNSILINDVGFGSQIVTEESDGDPHPTLHVGANASDAGIKLEFEDMTAFSGLKLGDKNVSIETADDAKRTLENIDTALTRVNEYRGKLGAYQNRLEYTINSLGSTQENLTNAESRIRDVDMAQEMVEFTKGSILNQAAVSMLAQANVLPMEVLNLLNTNNA